MITTYGNPMLIKQVFDLLVSLVFQPPNALSLPNFGSLYIFAFSMQNIENSTLK